MSPETEWEQGTGGVLMQFYNCQLNYAYAAERNHIKRPLFTNAQGSRERMLVKLFSLVVSVPLQTLLPTP